ncbi:MAG: Flavodoxin reductases (ferredoxin-NADPH reductases) family 1, partial [uncultured Friedmanniella sp.]
ELVPPGAVGATPPRGRARPSRAGGVRRDPAGARRLPRPGLPAAPGRRHARTGGGAGARDRRRRHRADPAGPLVAHPPPGPVHPAGRGRRRRAPVARLLPHLAAPCGRRAARRHRQGDPRREGQQPRRAGAAAGHAGPPGPGGGGVRASRGAARPDAVRHRRQRHHPGDGHAPQPPGRAGRRRRPALRAHRRRRSLRRRAAGVGGAGPAAAGRAAHRRRGRARPGRAGRSRPRLARAAHLGLRADRPAR